MIDDAQSRDLPEDLPPVEPPTAGFIVQLFVIPAVIVAVVVVVYLLFGRLAGGERDPADYVRIIRSENEYRRKQAAFELASLIHNDARLAKDPQLLGDLTDLLTQELDKEGEDPWARQYLVLTLGAFQTLETRSVGGRQPDPMAALALALAPKQPTPVRLAAAESLARHAARLHDSLDDEHAVQALAEALNADDPGLRERAAFALGFFGGEPATSTLRICLKQAADHFVRYNAAVALGRRGDPAARDVLREMLSPHDLAQFVRRDAENDADSRRKVEAIQLEALQALQIAASHGRTELAETLRPEVTRLGHSELVSVRTEAAALLKRLPTPPAAR